MAFSRWFWRGKGCAVVYILLAYGIVALGQPAWIPFMGLLASCVGFALFWRATFFFRSPVTRFCLSSAWYGGVQLFQLSWMTADDYQGVFIRIVWVVLALLCGLQFGVLSLFIRPLRKMTFLRILIVPSLWVLMEWSRLYLTAGYTWNPVGLALTGFVLPSQLVTLAGVYGLSFYVMLVNMLVLQLWVAPHRRPRWVLAATMSLFPYLFGGVHVWVHESRMVRDKEAPLSALLLQTGLGPLEKGSLGFAHSQALSPSMQWARILSILSDYRGQSIDLIVMPEGAVPLAVWDEAYDAKWARVLLKHFMGSEHISVNETKVSNETFCHALSDAMQADLVVGLISQTQDHVHNSALHFAPGKEGMETYDKRILLPFAESKPYRWMRQLSEQYGGAVSFTAGEEAKVFASPIPCGATICYEETFGNLVRQNRQQGAELLMNLSTDGWFPQSRLPSQHYTHGRLRALENGVPLLRACHTGITAAVDSLGRTIDRIGDRHGQPAWLAQALYVEVPRYHYRTLYTVLGDGMIVGLSILLTILALRAGIFSARPNEMKRSGSSLD